MMVDMIRLTGLRAFGYHGVLPTEKAAGQEFLVDVEIHTSTRAAARTDDLAKTIDYGQVAANIVGEVESRRFDLLETLAEHLCAVVLADHLAEAAIITVHKPAAPIKVPFGDVSVTIHRDRQHPPTTVPLVDASEVLETDAAPTDRDGIGPIPELVPDPADARGDGMPPTPPPPPPPAPPAAAAPVVVTPAVTGTPASPPRRSSLALPDGPHLAEAHEPPSIPVSAVLALGANLGDAIGTLRQAIRELSTTDDIAVTAVGPLARTAPVGGPADQPDYYNTTITIMTMLSPQRLLAITQAIEDSFGRVRTETWGPRTLDIDIVSYDDAVIMTADLELPHPRAHERAFVLLPWAHIAPDAYLHGLGGGPVATLAEHAPDRAGIRSLSLDWFATDTLPGPDATWQNYGRDAG